VREALQRLVQDGIARAEPRRGFYVASFSKRDIAEIYDLRATLEVMALRLAAPRLSIEELQQALDDLEQVAARITAARTPDERQDAVAAFLEIDRAFHRRLVQRANNRRLATTIEGLWAQILVFQQAGGFLPDMLAESIQQHRLVIGALLAGEIPEAAQLLEDHIAVKERVLAHIAGQLEARMGYEQYGTSVVDAHTRV
jgi:DNA-binding GntR family transcriptional regulator